MMLRASFLLSLVAGKLSICCRCLKHIFLSIALHSQQFDLLTGAAPTMGQSLFSRETILCFGAGEDNSPADLPTPNNAPVDTPSNAPVDTPTSAPADTPPNETRTCSTRVGTGQCIDSNDDPHPVCFAEGITFKECQQVAIDNIDVLGFTHYEDTDENGAIFVACSVHYDSTNADFQCPDTWENSGLNVFYEGTGPIRDSDRYPGVDCYTCELNFKPVIPPFTIRSCSKYGDGICLDGNQNVFPYCYKFYVSLELCKLRAAENNAIGIDFDDGFLCALLFDAGKSFECPTGYKRLAGSGDVGTGSIEGIHPSDSSDCYKCVDI
ncbi:hypothetical protein FisN_13Hu387 [Fistulifera solaris]|uniref:Uncharacterized protein n=1 Tax=Fistulifera solaris TaxID=1519565 RepID=A0A1Z5KNE5_FISSO|nr:hypothetical protein FisN_13Hu387 [Fistulifera solaris]|eukprot:GAX27531.1 hypothetical protein FisN_13Hu387 [Fistulifera solaris]